MTVRYFLINYQLGNFLKYIPQRSLKINFQNNTNQLLFKYDDYGINLNINRSIHTSLKSLAGHSKWANIKSTKTLKDTQKSNTFNKFVKLIQIACKETGGNNPDINSQLKKVLMQANNADMPKATVNAALKRAEKSELNAKEETITFCAPGGAFILVEILTDNIRRTRQEAQYILKKTNFTSHKGIIDSLFYEKGFIVAKGNALDALDHAIEAGAEDVTEDEDFLVFSCDSKDFFRVRQKIEELKYAIEFANIEKKPYLMVDITESYLESWRPFISKLEEHHEVIKVTPNFVI